MGPLVTGLLLSATMNFLSAGTSPPVTAHADPPKQVAVSVSQRFRATLDADGTVEVVETRTGAVTRTAIPSDLGGRTAFDLIVDEDGAAVVFLRDGRLAQTRGGAVVEINARLLTGTPAPLVRQFRNTFDSSVWNTLCPGWFTVHSGVESAVVFRFATGDRAVYDIKSAEMLKPADADLWVGRHFRAVLDAESRWAEGVCRTGIAALKDAQVRCARQPDADGMVLLTDEEERAGAVRTIGVTLAALVIGQDGLRQHLGLLQELGRFRNWSSRESFMVPWAPADLAIDPCSQCRDRLGQAVHLAALRLNASWSDPPAVGFGKTPGMVDAASLAAFERRLGNPGEAEVLKVGMPMPEVLALIGPPCFIADCVWEYDVPGDLPRTVFVSFDKEGVREVRASAPAWLTRRRDGNILGLAVE